MKRASFPLLAFVVIASTLGQEPAFTVTFVSPCECIAFHGVNRWVTKTDLTPVPSAKSAIQAITPSQIYAWEGLPPSCSACPTRWFGIGRPCFWTGGRIADCRLQIFDF